MCDEKSRETGRLYRVAGGMGLSLVHGLLVSSIASQIYYPRKSVVTMSCAIGLILRV